MAHAHESNPIRKPDLTDEGLMAAARAGDRTFLLNQKVRIKNAPDEIKGVVDHVGLDRGGPIYLVEWWADGGAYHCRWFRASQLLPGH